VTEAKYQDACTLVSVVVPVRSEMPWTEHRFRALAAQDVGANWEVVVADNGSDNRTTACVERWSTLYPRIQLVDASAGQGVGAARNIGVEAKRGRFLAFSDDEVRPGRMSSMATSLADADVVAGVFAFSGLDEMPQSVPIRTTTCQLGFLPFAISANLTVRREAFEAVNGFCEDSSPEKSVDLSWGLQCRPRLYRRYRADGMRRDLRGAMKAWLGLLANGPGLVGPTRRRQCIRSLAIPASRLLGAINNREFFGAMRTRTFGNTHGLGHRRVKPTVPSQTLIASRVGGRPLSIARRYEEVR